MGGSSPRQSIFCPLCNRPRLITRPLHCSLVLRLIIASSLVGVVMTSHPQRRHISVFRKRRADVLKIKLRVFANTIERLRENNNTTRSVTWFAYRRERGFEPTNRKNNTTRSVDWFAYRRERGFERTNRDQLELFDGGKIQSCISGLTFSVPRAHTSLCRYASYQSHDFQRVGYGSVPRISSACAYVRQYQVGQTLLKTTRESNFE